jgi:SAM-dependent methyltransferase
MDEKLKKYRDMQRKFYEATAEDMHRSNHSGHGDNPDYVKTLLMNINTDLRWEDAHVFEFGCGAGRNLVWLRQHAHHLREVSGCDISAHNVINTALSVCDQAGTDFKDPRTDMLYSAANTSDVHINYNNWGAPIEAIADTDLNTTLYVSSGIDCGLVPNNRYDLVFSTIVLQHICVHSTRYNIKESIFRTLKNGGTFSFQMGFDNLEIAIATAANQDGGLGSPALHRTHDRKKQEGQADYREDKTDASSTNSDQDVRIMDPEDVVLDLKKIGFVGIEYKITWSWQDDAHEYWIWFKAKKP